VRFTDPALLRRLSAGAERLDETLLAAVAVAARLEQPLRERAEAGSERAAKLAGELARVGGLEHEARGQSARANERAAAAELERARLGGEGQIRMLQVDEREREQVEREARDLTEEAERLALAAADASEAARTATVARSDNGGRARALDADLLLRVSPAPSGSTRRWPRPPRRLSGSTRRSAPASTRAPRARASWEPAAASSAPPRSRSARVPRKPPSARQRSRSS
jgi:hypothetical protein